MKPWYQSKIIWSSLALLVGAIGDLAMTGFADWQGFAVAAFAILIALFRGWGTNTEIGKK